MNYGKDGIYIRGANFSVSGSNHGGGWGVDCSDESEKRALRKMRKRLTEVLIMNKEVKFFVTLTFENDVDDEYARNRLGRFARNNRGFFVAERTKKGRLHFHGVCDCYVLKNDFGYYYCPDWVDGFSNASEIRDVKKVVSYVGKYVTKDIDRCLGARYYCSRGFKRFNLYGEKLEELLNYLDLKDVDYISYEKIDLLLDRFQTS